MRRIISLLVTACLTCLCGFAITYSKALEDRAIKGNPVAQYELGFCYANGITEDYNNAVKWYRKAAEQGNAKAQNSLGWCYYNGKGVTQDYNEAVKWYLKAAEQGYANAQNNLGVCYEYGQGVSQDFNEAVKWYRKAAEQGNVAAQNNLGVCYGHGEGVTQDFIEAVKWYRKAAEQGNVAAQKNLGWCYESGNGVSPDDNEAVKWYRKAAQNGNQWAIEKLKDLNEPLYANDTNNKTNKMKGTEFPLLNIKDVAFIDQDRNNCIDANEACKIKAKVVNSGKGTAKNCKAKISVKGGTGISVYDQSISTLLPNQETEVVFNISSNMQTIDGTAEFAISVDEPNGFGCDPTYLKVSTKAFKAPKLKLADYSITGENGGSLEKRKPFDLQVLLQNVAYGNAEDIKVDIFVPNNVYLLAGDEVTKITKLDPGKTNSLIYSLIVNNNYTATTIPIKITIREKYGKYGETQTINLKLNQTFAQNKIDIKAKESTQPTEPIQIAQIDGKIQQAEVDMDIPSTNAKSENTFAVIIGNENYRREENVKFAFNDAQILHNYMTNTLGLPQTNVRFIKDATRNELIDALDWINGVDQAYNGKASFIVYYAGHGIPDEYSKSPMLVPTDGFGSNSSTCIALNEVYDRLNSLRSSKVILMLDACFSGAHRGEGMLASARGIALKAKTERPKGNLCVLSAAQGDETAWPFTEKGHGMFTYYLLKMLQDTKGEATLGQLAEYIREQVSQKSIVVNRKMQTPSVMASERLGESWRNWKLK